MAKEINCLSDPDSILIIQAAQQAVTELNKTSCSRLDHGGGSPEEQMIAHVATARDLMLTQRGIPLNDQKLRTAGYLIIQEMGPLLQENSS